MNKNYALSVLAASLFAAVVIGSPIILDRTLGRALREVHENNLKLESQMNEACRLMKISEEQMDYCTNSLSNSIYRINSQIDELNRRKYGTNNLQK